MCSQVQKVLQCSSIALDVQISCLFVASRCLACLSAAVLALTRLLGANCISQKAGPHLASTCVHQAQQSSCVLHAGHEELSGEFEEDGEDEGNITVH